MRTVVPVLPAESGSAEGLAYSLWLPGEKVKLRGGVVILHGAGSCKENHHDFARGALAAGFAALTFDQRGHGGSEGPMDGRALADVAAMADLLRARVEVAGATTCATWLEHGRIPGDRCGASRRRASDHRHLPGKRGGSDDAV